MGPPVAPSALGHLSTLSVPGPPRASEGPLCQSLLHSCAQYHIEINEKGPCEFARAPSIGIGFRLNGEDHSSKKLADALPPFDRKRYERPPAC
jgi:hypothetical protein